MDENFLLTLEVLKYSPEVRTGVSDRGVVALKNTSSGTYLCVNEAQRVTLEAFRTPQTVPQMLGRAILTRTCLELGEFYELILKAHRAGILISDSKPTFMPAPKPSARWPKLPWQVAIIVSAISGISFLASIVVTPLTLPAGISDLLIGWAVWGAALSLGYLLGASVLHHAGGRFPPPRGKVFRPVPHAYVELMDSILQPQRVRSGVELICVAPLVATAAAACAYQQTWAALPMAGAIVALNPWYGPMARWRRLLSSHLRIDTDRDFLFSSNLQPKRMIRSFRRHLDGNALITLLAMSLVWLAITTHVIYQALDVRALELLANSWYWERMGIISGGLVGLFVLGILGWVLSTITKRRGARLINDVRHQSRRWKVLPSGRLAQAETLKAMSRSPLFRTLPMQKQLEITRKFVLKRYNPWRILSAPNEEKEIGLIVRGSAAATRRNAVGRAGRVQPLSEGDIFGAHSLVDPDGSPVEVRSRTPVLALTLPAKVFQDRIVQNLGVLRVHSLAHICSFLRSLPLCAGWQLASVIRLSEIARMRRYEKGEHIVQYAEDPRTFHIIWEGRVQRVSHGQVIEQFDEGDAFGDTELLQNSAAGTDAIAAEETRCLCVTRVDFIRFVTHNHRVALSFESRSSRRLGRPVFPLQASFDIQ
ncbi:MAG: cyclic nucleotide-binding domain-containing protein [Opitutaceae bacterium]|nr:cyclic nucleotide-binding domain-containing protein [Opitutaceae bacterium]